MYIKNILIPRNIEERKEKLRKERIKLLSQEVIEGDLRIDITFEGIPEELVKVKEIKGNVELIMRKDYIPLWLKNIKIYGDFSCPWNDLTSLENCPQYIAKDFICSYNELTTLEGCPKYIGEDLFCRYNKHGKILTLPKGVELKGKIYNVY